MNPDEQQTSSEPSSELNSTTSEAHLSSVQVRLPSFWSKNPRAWFCQVEAQFHLRRITTQISRYYHVLSSLPPELADEIDDVLAAPPPPNAYDHLKATILARTTESENSRLRQLLNAEELGDRRPTRLLHRVCQLLGMRSSEAHNNILRELFVQRLPANIRMILASTADLPIDKLADLADKIAEHAVPTLSSVTSSVPPSISTLENRIVQLTEAINALQMPQRGRQRTPRRHTPSRRAPSQTSRRHRSPSADSESQQNENICWYHRKFAARAIKCHRPCQWQENSTASR